jgi:hypothetical protein
VFAESGFHRLEEAHIFADGRGFLFGGAEGEGFGEFR